MIIEVLAKFWKLFSKFCWYDEKFTYVEIVEDVEVEMEAVQ